MWRMYVGLTESSRATPGTSIWNFDVGSRGHKLAELMVERKLLDRIPGGDGYCFGSSLFRVGDLSGFHGRFRAAAALT